MKTLNSIVAALLLASSMGWEAHAQLAITEVMAEATAPATGFKGPDFWELTNFGDDDLDLDGYGFSDNNPLNVFSYPFDNQLRGHLIPSTRPGVPRAINREIGDAVLTGKFDAGAMHLRRYYLDKDKPPGLTLMGSFSATPKIFVARSGLDTSVIAEFRKALVGLDRQQGDGQEQEPATCELDEPFTGAVAIDDSYFGALREALRKAARFDGLPDPFPTNPTPPTGGR